jgi:inorganic pyrophosphatase
MDEPAFSGCLLRCRAIGIIEGEQGEKKHRERNDHVVAIEEANHSYAHVKHVNDLGKKFVKELEEFFVNYHELGGKGVPDSRCSGTRGGEAADQGRDASRETEGSLRVATRFFTKRDSARNSFRVATREQWK